MTDLRRRIGGMMDRGHLPNDSGRGMGTMRTVYHGHTTRLSRVLLARMQEI